jgi:hypothetical protein
MRVAAIAIVAAMLVCTQADGAVRSRCETALDRVVRTVHAYRKQHPGKLYPRTLQELQQFATRRGARLDLTPFSEFTYRRRRSGEWSVLYTCRETGLGGALGGATISATH